MLPLFIAKIKGRAYFFHFYFSFENY